MKQNNLNQSGRSMVEMLGTLAIIGVLSVGGIMGYSYGMDKYRANRTMNDVRLRAMDVLAQFNATGDASLDNWKNEKTIYPITLEDETIGIQVDKVPERVCEMMAEGMEHSSSAIKINAEYVEEDAGDCGDDNTLVFYFDDVLPNDEENVNEPIREQCGDILCEQCFKCDQDTMTCVSVLDELEETADNVDDFRICANNGYKSYCGLLGDGCAEIGTCGGDPECNVRVDGACQPLDSTFYLQMGVGGFRCTKNGKDGYCFKGVCSEEIPDDVTACAGKEDEETCEVNGQSGMCLEGMCFDSCSNPMGSCDAFGAKGFCLEGICIPLTDDGCHVSLFGQTIPLPDEFNFACEKDGVEGVCISGACVNIDPTCVENGGGATCTINGENGYCMYDGSCAPIEAACSEKENGAECTKNEQVGACLFGQCIAKCFSEKSKCDAFGQDGICSLSLCFPLLNECYYDLLGAKNTIPENLSFACGNNGYCSNGSCISRCTADSDCTDATKPFCRDDGVCIACTQDSHCGDTVSDYCQNNVCQQCSSSSPAWDAKKQECVECLDNSHCAYEYTYDDKPYCVNRTCVECTSHDHCDAVQYCGDANTSGTEAHLGGSCHDLDYTDYTITYTDTSGASKTGTFYIASDSISWWDANSFCNTLGRKLGKSLSLPAVSELSVEIQNGGLIDTEHHPSDLAKQLKNKAGIYAAWTSDISSVDTSKATYVKLDMAGFLGTNIYTQDRTLKRIAVCR